MKSWLVIPATGVVSCAVVIAVTRDPFAIGAAGLMGAAASAAIRALAGNAPAALVAAVLAPLLVIASLAEHHLVALVPCLSIAAIAWTIVELARTSGSSPLVAMLPATIAAVLEPAAIALLPIAGTRLVTASWNRPKWAIAVPIAGGLAVMLCVIAGAASDGMFHALGLRWFGAAHPISAPALATTTANALGPLTAVAAIAGLALIAKLRLAEVAVASCAIGALLVDLRAGTTGSATLAIAGLAAAFAIGRFAATIRLPPIQAVAGATAALVLLVPPAWTVVEYMR